MSMSPREFALTQAATTAYLAEQTIRRHPFVAADDDLENMRLEAVKILAQLRASAFIRIRELNANGS